MSQLKSLLDKTASRHTHLCPRQVLGVRMALAGAAALDLSLPRADRELVVILETDGCFSDGVEVATGCTVGHRTLRGEDYGKVAATFVGAGSGRAVRLAPRTGLRKRAHLYAPGESRRYFAQLHAYQVMPADELFSVHEVRLRTPLEAILGGPGQRVECAVCGEDIINGRAVAVADSVPCRSCAVPGYYDFVLPAQQPVHASALDPGSLARPGH